MTMWGNMRPTRRIPPFTPFVPPDPTPGALPGQVLWNAGSNNFLFGSNDTLKWQEVSGAPDTLNSPNVKALVNSMGFGIIRQWFPKYEQGKQTSGTGRLLTHTDFDNYAKVCENAGAVCFGVLYQWQDVAYMQDVIGYLGNRCLMYEFGNEPYGTDYPYPGYPASVINYVDAFKNTVPLLKQTNPNALIGGPSSPGDISTLDAMCARFKNQGVRPDFITYHYYGSTSSILSQVDQGRAIVDNYFDTTMPFGLTEWNIGGVYPIPTPSEGFHDYTLNTLSSLIGHVDFAMHFDIASENQYPATDLDMIRCDTEATVAAKPSYTGMADAIALYKP